MIKATFMGTCIDLDCSQAWQIITEDKYGMVTHVRNYYRRKLEEMPFDRADDSGFGLVHATGYEYFDEVLGNWYAEYENDPSYLAIIGEL